ncbi:MAG: sulfatase [Lentisphaerae bacterium RIFOXYB12_FULL_65_16]|nr:MAG: sulfatase [Lentisphaerae bacterium RIFOXYA12_64_32]OGV88229.1 MAG: sulfatase [Lentisphaerae bacterium RIFOXYB12_FULL_65_16]
MSSAVAPAVRPPNILVFLVDDMGWQDTSVPFHAQETPLNRRYHTPAMARLASGGVKFTQAYCACVCSPSRVSLLTGLNAARHRVTNWTMHRDRATDAKHAVIVPPEWNVNGISLDPATPRAVCAPTLPGLLRRVGYRTIHVGKAHFGAEDTPGADPLNLGFDVNVAGHAAGGPGSYLSEQGFSGVWRKADRYWDIPGLDKYHGTGTFLTEALTREALAEMDRAVRDQCPFFLYMSHYAVHVPFAPDPRFIQRYRDAGLDETEAQYAALIEGMDKSLGDLLDALDRHGIGDNTLVLFLSDNGGLSAHGRGGPPHTHNAPLSSGKGSAHEGGIRVPMLVRWPGVTAPASVCDHYTTVEDILPTLLEVGGAAGRLAVLPPGDGRSLVPLLRRADAAWPAARPLFWHYPNIWGPTGPGLGPFSAIRAGAWKLIDYHADRRFELFNVVEDISETTNRLSDSPATARALAEQLSDWFRQVGAQMPGDRTTGHLVPLPDAALAAAAGGGAPGRPTRIA